MLKKSRIAKIISGIVIGGMVLTIGSVAMADTKDSSNAGGRNGRQRPGFEMRDGKMGGPKGSIGMMAPDGMKDSMDGVLKSLVEGGTITQEKADELKAYMDKKHTDRQAEFEKVKNMTPEERKTYFDSIKSQQTEQRQDMFTDAVKDNILTQEQADAIKDKMHQMAQEQRQQELADGLKSLVEKGTINQEQMDKISTLMETQEKAMQDMFQKTKDMTMEERREYMKNNVPVKRGHLSELVDNGSITQEQADEVHKVLGPKGHGMRGFQK